MYLLMTDVLDRLSRSAGTGSAPVQDGSGAVCAPHAPPLPGGVVCWWGGMGGQRSGPGNLGPPMAP